MENEHPSIAVARINARQAIIGALIVGVVSIITTLIATGYFRPGPPSAGTSGDADGSQFRAAVLDAPHLDFTTKRIDFTLGQCMQHARQALSEAGYKGLESRRYFAWAYNGERRVSCGVIPMRVL